MALKSSFFHYNLLNYINMSIGCKNPININSFNNDLFENKLWVVVILQGILGVLV